MDAVGFFCMCENGGGSDVRKTRRGHDHGLRKPQSSIMSRTHSSLVGLRLSVVSAGFTIWTEDICLQGLGNKQGEKNPVRKKKNKTWKKPQKDPQRTDLSLHMDRTDVTCPR